MADPSYGRNLKPGSLAQLSSFTRGWNDQEANFLLPIAFQDKFFKFYDFENDTISSDFTVANGGGTGVSNFAASTSLEFGQLTGSTGTSNDATAAVSLNFDGVFFDAARNPGMMVRLKCDAILNMYLELSWCDAPTQPYVLNWSDVDTPTQASNGVTDIASIVIDTSQTHKGAQLISIGTTDSTATATTLATATATAGSPLTAATFSTFLLQCGSRWSYANIDGQASNEGRLAIGMDTAIKLRPQIMCQARSATAVVVTIDYIALWCDRE